MKMLPQSDLEGNEELDQILLKVNRQNQHKELEETRSGYKKDQLKLYRAMRKRKKAQMAELQDPLIVKLPPKETELSPKQFPSHMNRRRLSITARESKSMIMTIRNPPEKPELLGAVLRGLATEGATSLEVKLEVVDL